MRLWVLFLIFCGVLAFAPATSFAIEDSSAFSWDEKPWDKPDFKPYLEGQPIKNRILWDRDQWTPQDWAKDKGEERRVLRYFYEAGILTQQFTEDGVPVLEVGYPFLRLSNTDRIRVLEFVDHIFEITKQRNGMFFVQSALDDEGPIGVFDKRGFQQY